MDAVVVKGVNKTFRTRGRESRTLQNVSLTIKQGEIYGLLGPNGAGKTTLISVLVGLTTQDTGVVEIFGKDVIRQRHEVQEIVNMVRGFSGVVEKFTSREMLTYYALLYDAPRARMCVLTWQEDLFSL